MFNFNEEIIRRMLHAQLIRATSSDLNLGATYEQMEMNCESNVTDEDMLKLHIDMALQNGDKITFLKLTEQLAVSR